jgi:hypothetical protein
VVQGPHLCRSHDFHLVARTITVDQLAVDVAERGTIGVRSDEQCFHLPHGLIETN